MRNQGHRKLVGLAAVCCLAVTGILCACGPQEAAEESEPAADAAEPQVSAEETPLPSAPEEVDVQASLVDHLVDLPMSTPDWSPDQVSNPMARMNSPESLDGSGVFPDNYYTADILHTGARGCMSCHADLYGLVKNLSPTLHVASPPTYGKPDDIKYCLVCHGIAGPLTGPKLSTVIHSMHNNNDLFVDAYEGDCWSCHAINTDGEMVLWDTIKFNASASGYPDANADDVLVWLQMRGFESGNPIGFDVLDDLELEIVSE